MTEETEISDYNKQLYQALDYSIRSGQPDSIIDDIIQLMGTIDDEQPLKYAIGGGHLYAVEKILQALSPSVRQLDVMPSLVGRRINDGVIKSMLNLLVNVSTKNSIEKTSRIAVMYGDYAVIKGLLEKVSLSQDCMEHLIEVCIRWTDENMTLNKVSSCVSMNIMEVLLKHLQPSKYILSRILAHATKYRWQKVVEETIRMLNILVNEKGEAK